jgi:predicted DNA-binding protein
MEAKLTVRIPRELRQKAKMAAVSRGETLSDVVRRALEAYVAETSMQDRASSEAVWARIAAESFLAGYSEEDAIYDQIT